MKKLLPLLLCFLSFTNLSLHAADGKAAADHSLSEYKLGTVLANDEVTMDGLKGKVVVLEMWGIHCGPCLASMPNLDALYKRNKDKGLMIVGLHSQQASDEEIQDTVKKLKVKFPITKDGGGPHEGNGIPHSMVFDTTGKLVFEGHPMDADFEKSVKRALKDVNASADASSSKSPMGLKPAAPAAAKTTKAAALIAERPWTNTDGKIMSAALISVNGDKATFKKKDGSTFTYALSKLNEEDQATIKEAADKAKEGATTNP